MARSLFVRRRCTPCSPPGPGPDSGEFPHLTGTFRRARQGPLVPPTTGTAPLGQPDAARLPEREAEIQEAVVHEPDVASVMTTQVTTARPDTPFKDVIQTMTDRQISAVPVVDEQNRPIGVVSEADALAKQEFHGGEDEQPHGDPAGRARWYRALARSAGELMTTPVRTVPADEPVSV